MLELYYQMIAIKCCAASVKTFKQGSLVQVSSVRLSEQSVTRNVLFDVDKIK